MPAVVYEQHDGSYHIRCKTCLQLLAGDVRSPGTYAELIVRHEKQDCPAVTQPGFWLFDNPETRQLTEARMEFITPLLRELRASCGIESALDAGCGLGDFSDFLWQFGIRSLHAFDGRPENVAEAQRRYPHIPFRVQDVEELSAAQQYDLVLCFGLLYHLENPFRAIRRLQAVTRKTLLIESMHVPGNSAKLELFEEWTDANQGLNHVAFYPTEACLSKMLHHSGFAFVYRFRQLPINPLYVATTERLPLRTMLLASRSELPFSNLVLAHDSQRLPYPESNVWGTRSASLRRLLRKIRAKLPR